MDQWWQNLVVKNLKHSDILSSTSASGGDLGETGVEAREERTQDATMLDGFWTSTSRADDGDQCDVWAPTQRPLLKLSMVLTTFAFFVPPKRGNLYMVIIFRALMTAAMSVGVAWGLQVCSPDVIIWNFLFLGVNIVHLLYNLYKIIPPRLQGDTRKMYERYFKPYKVSKTSFIRLRTPAWECELETGHDYFSEGSRGAAQNISVLMKGRLVVTHKGSYLHDIRPLEFVDSLEWQWRDRNEDRLETRFQVTVTASEDSSLLCWRMRDMESIKNNDPFAYTVFDHVVAMDAISKLYRCAGNRSRAVCAPKTSLPFRPMATIDSIGEESQEDDDDDKSMLTISAIGDKKRKSTASSTKSNSFLQVPSFRK